MRIIASIIICVASGMFAQDHSVAHHKDACRLPGGEWWSIGSINLSQDSRVPSILCTAQGWAQLPAIKPKLVEDQFAPLQGKGNVLIFSIPRTGWGVARPTAEMCEVIQPPSVSKEFILYCHRLHKYPACTNPIFPEHPTFPMYLEVHDCSWHPGKNPRE